MIFKRMILTLQFLDYYYLLSGQSKPRSTHLAVSIYFITSCFLNVPISFYLLWLYRRMITTSWSLSFLRLA